MELSKQEIERQDFVDNSIFDLLQSLKSSDKTIEWNIEMIGDIRDVIQYWIVERCGASDEASFYPFLKE
jgi:hypothetical protein